MWSQVQKDLAELLTSRTFPALRGVAGYEKLLKPNGQPDEALCNSAAKDILADPNLKSGIKEFGRREAPKVMVLAKPICRAMGLKTRADGPWWFDEELVQRWGRNYPPGTPNRKQAILESMRPMLAVCIDWNGFKDLLLMQPGHGGIPVITGQGSHMPLFSPDDKLKRYDPKEKVVFIGGFTQVYVPFVNPVSTSPYRF